MKKKIIILLFILGLASCNFPFTGTDSVRKLKSGDNLRQYFSADSCRYSVIKKENEKELPSDVSILLNVSKKKNCLPVYTVKIDSDEDLPFAVLLDEKQSVSYLIDIDGDGLLDDTYNRLLIPYWVLSRSGEKGSDPVFIEVCDMLYGAFQNDAGPASAGSGLSEGLARMKDLIQAPDTINRDMYFALMFYSRNSQKYMKESFKSISYLSRQMRERYGSIHPLILLFTLESLVNMKAEGQILPAVDRLLAEDPDSIPGLAYRMHYTGDRNESKKIYNELKKKHPSHWIVKQL